MPRDGSDDAYEELGKILYEREQAKAFAKELKKMARRHPRISKPCKSCGCEQKYHLRSRGYCEATVEAPFSMSGQPCGCLKFH